MAPNSNHKDEIEGGFGGVKGTSDYVVQSPNQSLEIVQHPTSAIQISPGIDDGRVGIRTSSSNPKASKKKNGYHHRQGVKKQRLIWTPELHQLFLEIHNRFPNEKVFPKKILEQMREKFPFVTRENVASHLQKHRLFLKKMNGKENSTKSSSKSVPLKVPKESNSQPIPKNTSNSSSTNPNSQLILQSHSNSTNPNHQLILQSHSNSTNPNSKLILQSHSNSNSTNPNPQLILQSHSNSTNPNSELLLQTHPNSANPNSHLLLHSHPNSTNPNSHLLLHSHPNSTNPNSHLSLPKKCHIIKQTCLNHELHFHFDQTNHVSNQTMMEQQQPNSFNNNIVHGGTNIYSNMINVCESQENPNWALPIGPSSIAATTTDLPFGINHYPPTISANHQISNIDANSIGNGIGNGIGFHPIMDYNSFGGLNDTNYNDCFLGTLPNFGFGDYDMNLNFDKVQVDNVLNNDMGFPGSCFEPLDFGYPFNFSAINNDFQMDFEQGLQSIFYPSVNHMKGDSTLQQCFGSYHHHLLPQTFDRYALSLGYDEVLRIFS